MPTELDHIFICASHNAEEAERLTLFGLTEGASNTHPGQGTASRRFFFRNAYLELLWVNNSIEARSVTTLPLRIWERWTNRGKGVCPFGLGFRPAANQPDEPPPFADWAYRPAYLPEPLSIHVAKNSDVLNEPMLFYLPFARRPDTHSGDQRQPLEHAAGLREISRFELLTPHARNISTELATLESAGLIGLRDGESYRLELGFDGETQGRKLDFRPALPLVFHW